MRQNVFGHGNLIGPRDWFKIIPSTPVAASDRLSWVGLEAARYRAARPAEFDPPALTHHRLVLFIRPPKQLELRYDGVRRHVPPPAGSISLIPAGLPSRWRPGGGRDLLHVYLEPALVRRVAAEGFDLDPARMTVPPLDGQDLPHLRSALRAVDAELAAGGPGGNLAAESLANVLAVHLIRHVLAPSRPARGPAGALPRGRLRSVVEFVEDNLDVNLTLGQMAAVARFSPYHFARLFKQATGLPPHQYVITRRVERARARLQQDRESSLAEVAADAGFSDQSQFSHHFKRVIGVTPGQFRMSARIA
jgi:AraC family transcriptional regulator